MNFYSKKPQFKQQSSDSPISEIAMRIIAINENDEMFASGTCVSVASNLVIAARHVIVDFFNKYDPNIKVEDGCIIKNFSIWVLQIIHDSLSYGIWEVESCGISPFTDVAFLHLKPYNEEAAKYMQFWKHTKLNLIPPPIGSRIVGFGYHDSKIKITKDNNGVKHIDLNDTPSTSVGEVIDIHEPYRDKGLLKFPCYQVNAKFKGGMSGGPVFNNDGELCGIICSGTDLSDSKDGDVSYVTTLWPSMGTLISGNRGNNYKKNVSYPVLELVKDKIISAKNWQNINFDKNLSTISINPYLNSKGYKM